MSEIDPRLVVALRDRAEGAVHVEELLAGARRRGVRRQRVRRGMLGVGVTAAVAAAVVVVPVLRATTPPLAEAPAARMPVAGPGDINVLRLDVSDPGATYLSWESDTGWELLNVGRADSWNGSFNQYRVMRAPSEAGLDIAQSQGTEALPGTPTTEQITFDGHPATLKLSGVNPVSDRWATLRWSDSAGTWFGVFVVFGSIPESKVENDRAGILQAAQWIRSGQAYHCLVDFRLAWAPQGSQLSGCELTMDGARTRLSGVLIRSGDRSFMLRTSGVNDSGRFSPNATTAGGKQVEIHDNGARYVYGDRAAELHVREGSLSRDEMLQVIDGFAAAEPTADPLR